jgi:hypothetical protein
MAAVEGNMQLMRGCAHASLAQVCIDLFLMAQSYCDVASLRQLPLHTGGQLHHYCPFSAPLDAEQLQNDLRWNAMRPQARLSSVHACMHPPKTVQRLQAAILHL